MPERNRVAWNIVAVFVSCLGALGQPLLAGEQAFVLTHTYETASIDEDGGGRSSTSGRTVMVERLVEREGGAVEIELDLPPDATLEDRQREWMFPVKARLAADGALTLLNRADMTARVDEWLTRAKLPRDACGKWYFTWNAFQVQCDPDEALDLLRDHGLGFRPVAAGQPVTLPLGLGEVRLRLANTNESNTMLTATVPIDPEAIRAMETKSAAVVREIMGKQVAEDPTKDFSTWRMTGHVTIELRTDGRGLPLRRILARDYTVTKGDGQIEKRTGKETLEREVLTVKR